MIILIRKRHTHVLIVFLCLFCSMAVILWNGREEHLSVMANVNLPNECLFVIDAGHGGEDGGAISDDGTAESGINLEIAKRFCDLLRFFGQQTAMIRSEDVSVGTPGLTTFRLRKASDLKNRVSYVNSREHVILVSIHQNSLPSVPSVHGAQVFYNTEAGAKDLAERMQDALNLAINPGNEKNTRQIPDSIYLMKHSKAPAVLVECGFLSNATETTMLKLPSHQIKIAASMLSGILGEPEHI